VSEVAPKTQEDENEDIKAETSTETQFEERMKAKLRQQLQQGIWVIIIQISPFERDPIFLGSTKYSPCWIT
jgi:hypothetical protein